MKRYLRITRDDLRHMINEVCRRVAMIKESINEGGGAGHMSYATDMNEFTFGDYKELIKSLFGVSGENAPKITDITEKLDGMNVMATVTPEGELRFARNKTQIKGEDSGMNIDDMRARWLNGTVTGQTTFDAYENAYLLFQDMLKKLPDPVEFFNGNGYKIYANCEVIDQKRPNLIPYQNTALSVHGLIGKATDGTGANIEIPEDEYEEKMELLRRVLPTVSSSHGIAQVTQKILLKPTVESKYVAEKFIKMLNDIESEAGVDDTTTMVQYFEIMFEKLMKEMGYGEFFTNDYMRKYFLTRWTNKAGRPGKDEKIPIESFVELKKRLINDVPNIASIIKDAQNFESGKFTEVKNMAMWDLQRFGYKLGNEVFKICSGFANEGNKNDVIEKIAQRVDLIKATIMKSGNRDIMSSLSKELRLLDEIGSGYNAQEGIVVNLSGRLIKITGSFNVVNRINQLMNDLEEENQA